MSVVNAGLVAMPDVRPGHRVRPDLCGFSYPWIWTNNDQFPPAPLSYVVRYLCDVDGRPTDYGPHNVIAPGKSFPFGLDLEPCPPPL